MCHNDHYFLSQGKKYFVFYFYNFNFQSDAYVNVAAELLGHLYLNYLLSMITPLIYDMFEIFYSKNYYILYNQ